MSKDFRDYINVIGQRLGKAFKLDEFGLEEELNFWSLSAEHFSRIQTPSFQIIAEWVDLLYNAPVHFVYKKQDNFLVLFKQQIFSQNIIPDAKMEKMPHEQTQQEKEFIQSFEYQLQNLEKKMDWDDEFGTPGFSNHTIGKCEHIPLYDKKGEVWGVYFSGPNCQSPELINAKLSIVGRILSEWLIALEEEELSSRKQYQRKIDGIVGNLGYGKLNVHAISELLLKYSVNSMNADSGVVINFNDPSKTILCNYKLNPNFLDLLQKEQFKMSEKDSQLLLPSSIDEFLKEHSILHKYISFTGGGIWIQYHNQLPNLTNKVYYEISTSVSNLITYKEKNIEFSNSILDTFFLMIRNLEISREKTKYHTLRLVSFAERFSMLFGLTDQEAEILKQTAKLHDIGYIGSISIDANKTYGAELSHPIIGAKLIEQLPINEDIIEGVRTHHEWVNGKGGVLGIKEEEISWTGKIIGMLEFIVEFIESNRNDTSKTGDEWTKILCSDLIERADQQFDMLLIPTVIQLIEMLEWEGCCTLGELS